MDASRLGFPGVTEDYIDPISILDNPYMDVEAFLGPIEEVDVR